MKFGTPKCPRCGELANSTAERIPGKAMFDFDAAGIATYNGHTEIDWDAQESVKDPEGRVTLTCGDGHEWQSTMEEIMNVNQCDHGHETTEETRQAEGTATKAEKALAILAKIDGPELKAQRQLIYEILDSSTSAKSKPWRFMASDEASEILEGAAGLLESIADFCHDELGMDTILTEDEES